MPSDTVPLRSQRFSPQRIAGLVLGVACVALFTPRPADACGVLVFEQHEERVGGMSDQEVVYLISATETVVVVSAGYVESTDDFAFLLPVASAPDEVFDGDPRLFYALDEGTAPRVTIFDETTIDTSGDDGGCGCGTLGDSAGALDEPNDDVVVVARGATTTYDYAVVGGDSGESLADWLGDEGFSVPSAFDEALQGYLDDGWLFLAARVQPGTASGVLSPLELHFPGATPEELSYPIGISAYSLPPGESLSISLYVIASDGVVPRQFVTVRIPPTELRALSPTRSNYEQVLSAMAQSVDGGAFVLERRLQADPTELSDWLDSAENNGRMPSDLPQAETTVAELESLIAERLGSAMIVSRFRTELTTANLRDTGFQTDSFTPVTGTYDVYWSGEPTNGTDVGTGAGLSFVGLLGLATVLGWRDRVRSLRS